MGSARNKTKNQSLSKSQLQPEIKSPKTQVKNRGEAIYSRQEHCLTIRRKRGRHRSNFPDQA